MVLVSDVLLVRNESRKQAVMKIKACANPTVTALHRFLFPSVPLKDKRFVRLLTPAMRLV